jgi:lysophospholipase L1-like esterase
MLLTTGDSFTYGTELEDNSKAWPYMLAGYLQCDVVNLAEPGASNDFILRSTVEGIKKHKPTLVIVAWTTPDRFELNGEHYTPNRNPREFRVWDSAWAERKFATQVELLERYIQCEYYFTEPWDCRIHDCSAVIGQLVEFCEGFEKGTGGHPLQQGHIAIARRLFDAIEKARK